MSDELLSFLITIIIGLVLAKPLFDNRFWDWWNRETIEEYHKRGKPSSRIPYSWRRHDE